MLTAMRHVPVCGENDCRVETRKQICPSIRLSTLLLSSVGSKDGGSFRKIKENYEVGFQFARQSAQSFEERQKKPRFG